MSWQQLSAQDAAKHPQYGLGGWLALFQVLMWLGLLRTLGNYGIINEALRSDFGESSVAYEYTIYESLIGTGLYILFILFFYLKSPIFIFIMIVILAENLFSALILGTTVFSNVEEFAAIRASKTASALSRSLLGALGSALFFVFWIVYFFVSARANITFRKRVRQDDLFLHQLAKSKDREKTAIGPADSRKISARQTASYHERTETMQAKDASSVAQPHKDQTGDYRTVAMRNLGYDSPISPGDEDVAIPVPSKPLMDRGAVDVARAPSTVEPESETREANQVGPLKLWIEYGAPRVSGDWDGLSEVEHKECPACAETIRLRARVCKECGHKYSDEEYSIERNLLVKLRKTLEQERLLAEQREKEEAEEHERKIAEEKERREEEKAKRIELANKKAKEEKEEEIRRRIRNTHQDKLSGTAKIKAFFVIMVAIFLVIFVAIISNSG